MGNACVDGVMFGCGVIVSVDSCMAPKVRGQSYSVVLHVCVVDVCKESCLVHSVKTKFQLYNQIVEHLLWSYQLEKLKISEFYGPLRVDKILI